MRPYFLWNLSEYELVIHRPVCRIHGTKFRTMRPIVTFLFCQNLSLDKVTWWLNNDWHFYITLFFTLLPPVLEPVAANPLEKVGINNLITSAKFPGKVLSRLGVDILPPCSSPDLRNHTWYKVETSISTCRLDKKT